MLEISPIFTADYFGSVNASDNMVQDSAWAGVSVPGLYSAIADINDDNDDDDDDDNDDDDGDDDTGGTDTDKDTADNDDDKKSGLHSGLLSHQNGWGFLRSYWNTNPAQSPSRHLFDSCGVSITSRTIPDCER